MNFDQHLLVEGNDDLHIIKALCKTFNIGETFDIIDCKGVNSIIDGLAVRLKSSGGVRTIGVVVDADINISNRWVSIRNILMNSNIYGDIPVDIPNEGLILTPISSDDIKFGLWIMPNNQTNGAIEDFIEFLIPENDNLLPIANSILEEIESKNLNRYGIHRAKAKIHTWLAWQQEPGTPMGLAITKKYLTTTPYICTKFVDWLRNLYI